MPTQRFQTRTTEVTIDRLGRDGDGLAGRVRVPFSLPGERVRGTIEDGRIADPEILAASPERVPPPCRHFGTCGGCALQHASAAFLAGWKAGTIGRALSAHGLDTDIRPTLVSPPRSRRRVVLSGRRTRKTVLLGFHGRRSADLVDIAECHVIRPEILACRPTLVRLARIAASRAQVIRLSVSVGPAGLDIDLRDGKPLDATLGTQAAGVAEAGDLARLSWNGEPVAVRRPPRQPMGRAQVLTQPGTFLQATDEGEAALVEAVRSIVADAGHVADLFAGCGTFSLPLAATAQVHAVEADAAMLAALDAGWRAAPGLRHVGTEVRDLFRRPLRADALAGFAAVVLDPPRAGAAAQCRELAASGVPVIAMVSCDPASFARDAALLVAGGYRLDWVQPIDQFLWSGHVELVARLSR